MIRALTPLQKLVAYSTLFLVFCWTLFGLFVMWLILTEY
jgi:hypothetical protein